jgi:hypothetical protein
MINYSDIVKYDNISFEDYLKLGKDFYSHSFLKRERNGIVEPLKITDNIRIGSLVDSIITEPQKADLTSELYPFAKDISDRIKSEFGSLISYFKKQLSYTGIASFADFKLPVIGRLDFLLESQAVIDLKVTKSKNIPELIYFMGYKNQLWHYARLSGVNKAYLLVYSIPNKRTECHFVDVSSNYNEFWADKIIDFGKV